MDAETYHFLNEVLMIEHELIDAWITIVPFSKAAQLVKLHIEQAEQDLLNHQPRA